MLLLNLLSLLTEETKKKNNPVLVLVVPIKDVKGKTEMCNKMGIE